MLKATRIFLGCRRHQDLYYELMNNLSHTFDFEACGVLFYEKKTEALYRLESGPDIRTVAIAADNVVRYPCNIGLTGVAIAEQQSLIFSEGEKDPRYKSDIDNLFNKDGIRNMMICPFFNKAGDEIRGCIHLMNRIGHDEILD